MKDLNLAAVKEIVESLLSVNDDDPYEDDDWEFSSRCCALKDLGLGRGYLMVEDVSKFIHQEASFLENIVKLIDIIEVYEEREQTMEDEDDF